MDKKTTIELNIEDGEKFKLFCKYFEVFKNILEADVFSLKNGTATLFFTKDGILKSIIKQSEFYTRKRGG